VRLNIMGIYGNLGHGEEDAGSLRFEQPFNYRKK